MFSTSLCRVEFNPNSPFVVNINSGVDVGVSGFALRPVYTMRVSANENPHSNFDFSFTYTIRGSLPSSIKYKFYMSPDGDSNNPDNKELRLTETTITSPTQSTRVNGRKCHYNYYRYYLSYTVRPA